MIIGLNMKSRKPYTCCYTPKSNWDRALSIYTYNLKQTGKNLSQDWAKIDHGRLISEGFKRSWILVVSL